MRIPREQILQPNRIGDLSLADWMEGVSMLEKNSLQSFLNAGGY